MELSVHCLYTPLAVPSTTHAAPPPALPTTGAHMEERRLHHLPQLLYLLFAPSDVFIGHIGLLLHLGGGGRGEGGGGEGGGEGGEEVYNNHIFGACSTPPCHPR